MHEKECREKMKRAIQAAAQCVKWSMPWMMCKRLARLTVTLVVYLAEIMLLLKMFDLLFGNVTGLKPFAFLLGLRPIAFLYARPPFQWLSGTLARVVNMSTPPVKAVGSVVGAIGIGGTFIALLTSSAERLVCGIRTGELLNWTHRFFFIVYGFVFLPLALLGIFSASSQRWEPTVYALLGVLIELVFTLLVCFEFVLSAKWREEVALQYYYKMVCPFFASRRVRRRGGSRKPDETGLPEIGRNVRRAMLSVADYSRNQAEVYHRNFSSNMVRLWICSCWVPFGAPATFADCGKELKSVPGEPPKIANSKDYCSTDFKDDQSYFKIKVDWVVHYPTAYISDGQDYIVAHTLLAKDIWAELLAADTLTPQELTITRQILYSLWVMKQDLRYTTVLLGLLFCLEDMLVRVTDPRNMVQLITTIDFITRSDAASGEQDNVPKEVRSELAWAVLMICVVAWVQERPDCDYRGMLDTFCQHFSVELNEYCEDLARVKAESATDGDSSPEKPDAQPENTARFQRGSIILWYAEWIARKRRGLSLDRYLMGISTIFGQGNAHAYFKLGTLSYRKTFLLGILCEHFNISYEGSNEGGNNHG